jgi:Tfp pilus assembly protein PilN
MQAVNLLPLDRLDHRRSGPFAAAGRNPAVLGVAAMAVIVAAVLGTMSHSASSSLTERQARLDEVRGRLAAIPSVKPVPQQLATASARFSALNGAASKRLPFDALLGDFSRVVPEDVWLLSLQATSPDATPISTTAPASASGTSTTLFTINGYTYSQPSVARLMKRLTLVPWLSNVQLQSSAMSEIAKRRVYQFTIGADVLNPEVLP